MSQKQKTNIFDLSSENGLRCAIIGGSGRGKTFLLCSMLKDKRFFNEQFDQVHLIHPEFDCEPLNKHYDEIKFTKVYKEFSQELVKQLTAYSKKMFLRKRKKGKDFKMLIIMDDCVSDDDMTNKQRSELGKTLCNSRKHGLSMVILSQKCTLLPQQVLSQCTHVILFNSMFGKEKKAIDDSFGLTDKQEWKALWSHCFQDFRDSLLVDLNKSKYYRNFNEINIKENNI